MKAGHDVVQGMANDMNRLLDQACIIRNKFGTKPTVSLNGTASCLAPVLEGSRSLNVPLGPTVGTEAAAVGLGQNVLGDVGVAIANDLQERAVLASVDNWSREFVPDVTLEGVVRCSCCIRRLTC